MAQPEQGLQRIGAAQLHINPAHTHVYLGRHFQQLEPHAPDRGLRQFRPGQAQGSHSLQ